MMGTLTGKLKSRFSRSKPGVMLEKAPGLLGRILFPGQGFRIEAIPRESMQDVGRFCRELDTLNSSMEVEFMELGNRLQEFYSRTQSISEAASSVAGLMSGNDITHAIEGLRGFLDRVRRLEDESRLNVETLTRILEELHRMQDHLSGFTKTIMFLRVLCTSTRIEGAQLHGTDNGFNTLSDDVHQLALNIESACEGFLAKAGALSGLIRRTLANVLELETRQQGQIRAILDQTHVNLNALTEKHHCSSQIARQLSERYAALSHSIGEIVTSMQFHDIVRQQIEHVQEALQTVTPLANSSEPCRKRSSLLRAIRTIGRRSDQTRNALLEGSRDHWNDCRRLSDVCELQAAQLRRAGDELMKAVGAIIEHLRDINRHTGGMAEEAQRMAGVADGTEQSFVSEVEQGFASIREALLGYADVNRELASTMHPVTNTVRDMAGFAQSIEEIGIKIKLIALNAIVKAAHLGEQGRGMSVLAEGIHQLSVETCEQTTRVGEALDAVSRTAESLSAYGEEEGSVSTSAGVDRIDSALQAPLDDIQRTNAGILSMLGRLNTESRSLAEEIGQAIAGITVHHHAEEILSRITAQLDETATHLRSLLPEGYASTVEDHFEHLERAYTMQGEREVHEAIAMARVGASACTASAGLPAVAPPEVDAMPMGAREGESAQACGEDLGDNVELF